LPKRSLSKQEPVTRASEHPASRITEVSLRPAHVDFTMSAKAGVAHQLGTAWSPGTRIVEPFVGSLTSYRRHPAVIVRIRMRNGCKSLRKMGFGELLRNFPMTLKNFPMLVDRADPPRIDSDAYRALSLVSTARQSIVHAQQITKYSDMICASPRGTMPLLHLIKRQCARASITMSCAASCLCV